MDVKLVGDRQELTNVQWNIHLPPRTEFTDAWHNSYSQTIPDLHRCELNFCLRINKSMGIDMAIRKNTWNILWRVKIAVMFCGIRFETETDTWSEYVIFPDAIKIDLLKTHGSNNSPITAKCVIEWLYWKNNLIAHEILPPSPMIRELGDYFLNPKFSDVNIVFNGRELPAHKIILAGQSNRFAKMISAATDEKIAFPSSFDVKLIKIVLKYLYTGCDEQLNDFDTAMKILQIADECEISKLKLLCAYKLLGKLRIDTATAILEIADSLHLEDLRNHAMNFITIHKNDIMKLDDFKQMCLTNPKLSFEIFSFMYTGKL